MSSSSSPLTTFTCPLLPSSSIPSDFWNELDATAGVDRELTTHFQSKKPSTSVSSRKSFNIRHTDSVIKKGESWMSSVSKRLNPVAKVFPEGRAPYSHMNLSPASVLNVKMLNEQESSHSKVLKWLNLPNNCDKNDYSKIVAKAAKPKKSDLPNTRRSLSKSPSIIHIPFSERSSTKFRQYCRPKRKLVCSSVPFSSTASTRKVRRKRLRSESDDLARTSPPCNAISSCPSRLKRTESSTSSLYFAPSNFGADTESSASSWFFQNSASQSGKRPSDILLSIPSRAKSSRSNSSNNRLSRVSNSQKASVVLGDGSPSLKGCFKIFFNKWKHILVNKKPKGKLSEPSLPDVKCSPDKQRKVNQAQLDTEKQPSRNSSSPNEQVVSSQSDFIPALPPRQQTHHPSPSRIVVEPIVGSTRQNKGSGSITSHSLPSDMQALSSLRSFNPDIVQQQQSCLNFPKDAGRKLEGNRSKYETGDESLSNCSLASKGRPYFSQQSLPPFTINDRSRLNLIHLSSGALDGYNSKEEKASGILPATFKQGPDIIRPKPVYRKNDTPYPVTQGLFADNVIFDPNPLISPITSNSDIRLLIQDTKFSQPKEHSMDPANAIAQAGIKLPMRSTLNYKPFPNQETQELGRFSENIPSDSKLSISGHQNSRRQMHKPSTKKIPQKTLALNNHPLRQQEAPEGDLLQEKVASDSNTFNFGNLNKDQEKLNSLKGSTSSQLRISPLNETRRSLIIPRGSSKRNLNFLNPELFPVTTSEVTSYVKTASHDSSFLSRCKQLLMPKNTIPTSEVIPLTDLRVSTDTSEQEDRLIDSKSDSLPTHFRNDSTGGKGLSHHPKVDHDQAALASEASFQTANSKIEHKCLTPKGISADLSSQSVTSLEDSVAQALSAKRGPSFSELNREIRLLPNKHPEPITNTVIVERLRHKLPYLEDALHTIIHCGSYRKFLHTVRPNTPLPTFHKALAKGMIRYFNTPLLKRNGILSYIPFSGLRCLSSNLNNLSQKNNVVQLTNYLLQYLDEERLALGELPSSLITRLQGTASINQRCISNGCKQQNVVSRGPYTFYSGDYSQEKCVEPMIKENAEPKPQPCESCVVSNTRPFGRVSNTSNEPGLGFSKELEIIHFPDVMFVKCSNPDLPIPDTFNCKNQPYRSYGLFFTSKTNPFKRPVSAFRDADGSSTKKWVYYDSNHKILGKTASMIKPKNYVLTEFVGRKITR